MPVFPGDPLVTYDDYVLVTTDDTSASASVEVALEDAVEVVEQHTHRTLEYGEYTETHRVDSNGRVWPRATPLEAVSTPDSATILDASILTGYTGLLFPDRTLVAYWWDRPPEVTVTYSGGWTRDTLPVGLRDLICQVARQILVSGTSDTLTGIPDGAASVRVGDVAVTAAAGGTLTSSGAVALPSGLLRALKAWRKPQLVDV